MSNDEYGSSTTNGTSPLDLVVGGSHNSSAVGQLKKGWMGLIAAARVLDGSIKQAKKDWEDSQEANPSPCETSTSNNKRGPAETSINSQPPPSKKARYGGEAEANKNQVSSSSSSTSTVASASTSASASDAVVTAEAEANKNQVSSSSTSTVAPSTNALHTVTTTLSTGVMGKVTAKTMEATRMASASTSTVASASDPDAVATAGDEWNVTAEATRMASTSASDTTAGDKWNVMAKTAEAEATRRTANNKNQVSSSRKSQAKAVSPRKNARQPSPLKSQTKDKSPAKTTSRPSPRNLPASRVDLGSESDKENGFYNADDDNDTTSAGGIGDETVRVKYLSNTAKSKLLKQLRAEKKVLTRKKKKIQTTMKELDPEEYETMLVDVVTQIDKLTARVWDLSSQQQRINIVTTKLGTLEKGLKDGSCADIISAENEVKDLQVLLKQVKEEKATKRPIQRSLPTSMPQNVKQPLS